MAKKAPKKATRKQVKVAKAKAKTVSVAQFNRLERRTARLEAHNKKLVAASKVKAKPKTKRKASPYNKFVQKGLKAGKDMATIASEWKAKNNKE